jgi:hypothetical protein
MNDSQLARKSVLWLLLSVFSAGCMAYYVVEIWSAYQPPHFNDLYASWWAAHELFLHGRDPYSPAVAHEIQAVIYGAPADSGSSQDSSGIGGGFAYPPYAELLLYPTIYLSFTAAQKVFAIVSVLATLLNLTVWMRLLRFHWSLMLWITIAAFTLGSFPSMQAIKLQNPSLLAAALITFTLFLLARNQFIPAGIMLAASTFKPQFTIALILWLAAWTLGDWRRRRAMAGSFLITMLLLVLISEWLVPGWIRSFLHVINAYRHYTYGRSLLDVWFTPAWGPVVAVGLLLAVFALSWPYRSQPASSERFFLCASLLLAATLVVIPTLAPHAQILLLPGILCLVSRRRTPGHSSNSSAYSKLAQGAVWILLAWPWISACVLWVSSHWLPVTMLVRLWEVPVYTSPMLPLAVVVALACLLCNPAPSGNTDSPTVLSAHMTGAEP